MDMTAKPIPGRGKRAALIIAVGAFTLAAGVVDAAPATIYKCLDSHLGLTYTDQPCKGGAPLDVHPGDADPAAAARLARDRDELDRVTAARRVEERAAAQRNLAALAARQAEEDRSAASAYDYSAASSPYDDALSWYPAYLPTHPLRPQRQHPHRDVTPRRFAPNPPYVVPRS